MLVAGLKVQGIEEPPGLDAVVGQSRDGVFQVIAEDVGKPKDRFDVRGDLLEADARQVGQADLIAGSDTGFVGDD